MSTNHTTVHCPLRISYVRHLTEGQRERMLGWKGQVCRLMLASKKQRMVGRYLLYLLSHNPHNWRLGVLKDLRFNSINTIIANSLHCTQGFLNDLS